MANMQKKGSDIRRERIPIMTGMFKSVASRAKEMPSLAKAVILEKYRQALVLSGGKQR